MDVGINIIIALGFL